MNRRSFFSKVRNAIGVIALAPQLCFKAKPEFKLQQHVDRLAFWMEENCTNRYMSDEYIAARDAAFIGMDVQKGSKVSTILMKHEATDKWEVLSQWEGR